MKNMRIRRAAAQACIRLWEVAEAMGITDSSLSRKLRKELPDDEQERILAIIERLKERDVS